MLDILLQNKLLQLEKDKLRRRLRKVEGPQGPKITLDGKRCLNFCSNNYLGLADDQRIVDAAVQTMQLEGFGSGASRSVCGSMSAHFELEENLAQFKGTESALVFNSGYSANIGIITALCGDGDLILSDRLNHASIIDGILLSRAEFRRYPHLDMEALENMLKEGSKYRQRLIVTDSIFSMDGDMAPLDKIVALAEKYKANVMIDEAHAVGVMGAHGKGLAEHFSVEDKIDIQMGTLSKALGCFGAYCCGSKTLTDYLINYSRSFIYTTAMPPALCAAATRALSIVKEDVGLRQRLWQNTRFMSTEIKRMGFNILQSQTPIIPILVKDNDLAVKFSQRLLEAGIFVSAIRPPTVPANTARLRLTVMATHSQVDLESTLEQFKIIGKDLCLI